jgi:serine/threonine protein kinase
MIAVIDIRLSEGAVYAPLLLKLWHAGIKAQVLPVMQVYEGRLNGMPVAVKLLVPATEGASRQDGFITTPGSPHPPAPLPSSATLDPGSEQLAGSPPPQAQVHQEVEALTQLQHPHILRLLGISSSLAPPARRQQLGGQGTNAAGKVPFLVYELVKGGTLAAAIHRDASHAAGAGDGPAGPILLPLAQILMVSWECSWLHFDHSMQCVVAPACKWLAHWR